MTAVAVVLAGQRAVHHHDRHVDAARRATAAVAPRSAISSTNATPSARRAARVDSGSAAHRSSPIIRRMNCSAASAGDPVRRRAAPAGAARPPRQPRQRHLVHGHRPHQFGMPLGERQGDVAAVAVPEHDGPPPVEQGDEVGDVGVDRERSAGAVRPGVAPAVVAQDAVAARRAAATAAPSPPSGPSPRGRGRQRRRPAGARSRGRPDARSRARH